MSKSIAPAPRSKSKSAKAGKYATKAISAAPARPAVEPPAASPTPGTLAFHPAVSPDLQPDRREGRPWNEFDLVFDRINPETESHGQAIATVTINPAFDLPTVERFMWLLPRAPELWRELRLLLAACDIDHLSPALDAFKLLWGSADAMPFGPELAAFERLNARAVRELQARE